MKRWFCLVFLIPLLLLPGCGQAVAEAGTENALRIVATSFVPYDFTREITGGSAGLTMLLPPASDSHSFEPTVQDILMIQNCDVFIYGGGESDVWVESLLRTLEPSRMKIIRIIDCVEDNGAAQDEHVWTSPINAKRIAQAIADAVCEANEANSELYMSNTAGYLQKLDDLDAAFHAVIGGAARNTIVFGDRFPFRHLADAYGLTYFAAFPGCSDKTEAGAKAIALLIRKVRDENIPVVFHTELSNRQTAETIRESTGAKILPMYACHTVSREDFLGGVTYLELMTRNVEALKEALW
ncbi:MAG: metal ABC transporter substrate-binding protein [Oscillospiraceae bacterium]|jgi:zinc transport system substrate-binding protein|nr:metal ABC transporter substrate-binding protein [Oscillospiraceae bacterium]